MSKLDLCRRQFVNISAAAGGLYAMSGPGNVILGEELNEASVRRILREGESAIPYIGITEDGPLYPPVEIPWLKDLTSVGGPGTRPAGETLYLFGQIFDVRGRPIEGATVEIWQADNNGLYKHPRIAGPLDPNFGYFGKVKTAKDGSYLFKTIAPRWYEMFGVQRANHIHMKMRHNDHGVLTTEVYFEGNEQEAIRRHDAIFQSRRNGERLIVPQEHPSKFSDLGVQFEDDAKVSRYDLAFIM